MPHVHHDDSRCSTCQKHLTRPSGEGTRRDLATLPGSGRGRKAGVVKAGVILAALAASATTASAASAVSSRAGEREAPPAASVRALRSFGSPYRDDADDVADDRDDVTGLLLGGRRVPMTSTQRTGGRRVEEDSDVHPHASGGGDDGHEDDDHDDDEPQKPWGPVIGATLLINLTSFAGLLLLVIPALRNGYLKVRGGDESSDGGSGSGSGSGKMANIVIPGFAVGALLATAVFLIFPEAVHLIEGKHEAEGGADIDIDGGGGSDDDPHAGHDHRFLEGDEDEGGEEKSEARAAAEFGMAVLGGYLLPVFVSLFFTRAGHNRDNDRDVEPQSSPRASNGRGKTLDYEDDNEDDVAAKDTVGDKDGCESCNDEAAKAAETGVVIVSVLSSSDNLSDDPENGNNSKKKIEIAVVNDIVDSIGSKNALPPSPPPPGTVVNRALCASVLVGDAFHNFGDGIFVGAAFSSCSAETAISIAVVTAFHEIAQELADFVVLTSHGGLSPIKALALNFFSGLSVMLGGIVVLAANPSDEAVGIVLAIAGGVYVNIAASETAPRIDAVVETRKDKALSLFAMAVGTIPIGLILLNHQHCGDGHDH